MEKAGWQRQVGVACGLGGLESLTWFGMVAKLELILDRTQTKVSDRQAGKQAKSNCSKTQG